MNQYVNPIGLESIQWKFYFVYIVILVIECLCIWFIFVETKGLTLEEVGKLLDGPEEQTQDGSISDKEEVFEHHVEVSKY